MASQMQVECRMRAGGVAPIHLHQFQLDFGRLTLLNHLDYFQYLEVLNSLFIGLTGEVLRVRYWNTMVGCYERPR